VEACYSKVRQCSRGLANDVDIRWAGVSANDQATGSTDHSSKLRARYDGYSVGSAALSSPKEHTDGFAFVAPAGGGIGGTVEDEAARLPG